jgi:hypothetical protein
MPRADVGPCDRVGAQFPAEFCLCGAPLRTRIQKALEAGGAQFIFENGGGPGVRLRKGRRKNVSRK